ncbi:putative carboxylesterase 11-like protein [Trifolium pratense]|uniref:Putative carboxylesterase 11-like protein n=1 Tax=Trifolium pratense TaxID=57577 RepID=A0A2K3KYC6_TRIPR|nr:putative carboxylesterase 11-like protein [Trifolium pratense]
MFIRCVLLGVSCGANIANYVARKAVETGKLLDPVKVVAQILMYPFYVGSVPTHSEIKLANSYFYDKAMCMLAWKLFLPEKEFSLDHPAANPLVPGQGPPLKLMPPTLTVVAEHDWMRDRAIAYSEELRKVNVDAPVLEYKDAVHEFATLDVLLRSPQAQLDKALPSMSTGSSRYSNLKVGLVEPVRFVRWMQLMDTAFGNMYPVMKIWPTFWGSLHWWHLY